MKMTKTFFALALAMLLAISLANETTNATANEDENPEAADTTDLPSFRGVSRILADPRATMTCDHFPRICRASGSSGPDCCRKQCVNVATDSLNCGQCGKKCRYGETCCQGNCLNVMYDMKNCGGCKNRCKKGSFCKYGMCSYA